jgi:hypothetical protein
VGEEAVSLLLTPPSRRLPQRCHGHVSHYQFSYAREAQLPFYVLHFTPIVVIGFFVVQWEVSVLTKFIVISLSSFAATLLLYDIGVRRTRLTCFLFGMKPKKESQVYLHAHRRGNVGRAKTKP